MYSSVKKGEGNSQSGTSKPEKTGQLTVGDTGIKIPGQRSLSRLGS